MVDGEEKKGKLHVCPHNRRSVSHDRPYGRGGGELPDKNSEPLHRRKRAELLCDNRG